MERDRYHREVSHRTVEMFEPAEMSHCLGLFVNYTGHLDGQLKVGRGKIFYNMLVLQMLFKLVCFHCLILQSAKYKQSPLSIMSP